MNALTPRYLSIADGGEAHAALSTVEAAEAHAALSILKRRKVPAALSIVAASETPAALSIDKIEARRRKTAISVARLLAEAGINEKTWRRARRDKVQTRGTTLERLDRALDRLGQGEKSEAGRSSLLGHYLSIAGIFAHFCGADVAAVHAMATDFRNENPNNPAWLIGARVRRLAMYLIACELQYGNAALANAIGCSRQNVKQAVKSIEELREAEPALDALIAKVAALAGRAS